MPTTLETTPWEMIRPDESEIVTIQNVETDDWGNAITSYPGHGDPRAYKHAKIPLVNDPRWKPAPVTDGKIHFEYPSRLTLYGQQQLDFIYLRTCINIPDNLEINQFSVTIHQVDDGAKVYLFNDKHKNGAPIDSVGAQLGGSEVTTDFKGFHDTGWNQIMIVQFDDNPTLNIMTGGVTVKVNNMEVPIGENLVISTPDFMPKVFYADKSFNTDGVGFKYDDGADGSISAILLQPNGNILTGGRFSSYNGVPCSCIVRLNPNGSLDTGFNTGSGANSEVYAMAARSDGKILMGGRFSDYNGTPCYCIARLNPNGGLDTGFNTGSGTSDSVFTLAVQSDNKILLGGCFTTYNVKACNRLARLNADGTLDETFKSGNGANDTVFAIALQADGQIYIGGNFTTYDGAERNRIARLDKDGNLDTTFNPGGGANDQVRAMAVQSDGKILIGGDFNAYGGTTCGYIARLNADGSLDQSFNSGAGADAAILAIKVQSDGKILIGGNFWAYDGTTRLRIARLNADGSLDESFNPGTGANEIVWTIGLQTDGGVLVGGRFSDFNGAPVGGLVRAVSETLVPSN